jgi:LmbE family N-acetylglucosaminyl deacetylase
MFLTKIGNKILRTKTSLFYGIPQYKSPKEWIIKPRDRFLVLSPHPDDESIGCGGFLLKYGSQCDVVLLTDGRHGDPGIDPKEMTRIRKKEFEEVMRILRINHYQYLDIEDGHLIDNFSQFKKIDINGYNYVLMPSPQDNHIDHLVVSRMFYKLISIYNIAAVKIVYYEIWSVLSNPTHYVDISDVAEKKRDIINVYRSQTKHIDYASRILALNYYRGLLHNNIEYEEDFIIG